MAVSNKTLELAVKASDLALRGSEYGFASWEILRECLLDSRDMTVSEASKVEDLIDRAVDDVKGFNLRVDLQLEKVY